MSVGDERHSRVQCAVGEFIDLHAAGTCAKPPPIYSKHDVITGAHFIQITVGGCLSFLSFPLLLFPTRLSFLALHLVLI